jgi:hypothetical protein
MGPAIPHGLRSYIIMNISPYKYCSWTLVRTEISLPSVRFLSFCCLQSSNIYKQQYSIKRWHVQITYSWLSSATGHQLLHFGHLHTAALLLTPIAIRPVTFKLLLLSSKSGAADNGARALSDVVCCTGDGDDLVTLSGVSRARCRLYESRLSWEWPLICTWHQKDCLHGYWNLIVTAGRATVEQW